MLYGGLSVKFLKRRVNSSSDEIFTKPESLHPGSNYLDSNSRLTSQSAQFQHPSMYNLPTLAARSSKSSEKNALNAMKAHAERSSTTYLKHFCKSHLIILAWRCARQKSDAKEITWTSNWVSLLMDVYSERIVTFKKPTIPTRHESELSTSLFNVRISDDVFFIYFKSMRCMELWTQSLLVGEWREIKISECLLFVESARTLARLKNIQIQAQKCAGWRLSDWKDFLEDAKSTFLPPFAAHSFNNNANWVSVILDPVSYLQDQNGHSMLFPSQAWHLRVRFHEMTGLWNLFFYLKGNFYSQKVFPFPCKSEPLEARWPGTQLSLAVEQPA